MASYMDQERQRTEEWREEQLNWLHEQNQHLAAQTALLAQIAKHTGLIYVLTIMCLGLVGVVFVIALASGATG